MSCGGKLRGEPRGVRRVEKDDPVVEPKRAQAPLAAPPLTAPAHGRGQHVSPVALGVGAVAAVAGVGVGVVVGSGGLARGVHGAGVADEDGALLHVVAATAVRGAAVDGVLVVEALAGRVQLDELVAHGERL